MVRYVADDDENETDGSSETETKLALELLAVVDYFRQEFEINYAQIIGTLEIVTFKLKMEAFRLESPSDDEDD